eukprot:1501387-Rhodomonas_salina.1
MVGGVCCWVVCRLPEARDAYRGAATDPLFISDGHRTVAYTRTNPKTTYSRHILDNANVHSTAERPKCPHPIATFSDSGRADSGLLGGSRR